MERKPTERDMEYLDKWTRRSAITHGIPDDRLIEICRAERDGLCVVLPSVKQKDRDSLFDALSEAVSSWGDMSAGEKKLSEALLKALRGERHGKDL